MSLSITPDYLKQLGLIDSVPPASGDTEYLLNTALEKVAFLPFGLLVDKWRWDVFSGKITPANYNQAWWELRTRYQGIAPPVARSESDFDPGSKSHIPGNTPYSRYFLARILQFQFYRAMCREAGFTGPLYRCSFYGNKAAGEKLNKMLSMGASKPWPEELEALTGEKKMDAGALIEYFGPFKIWLEEQNRKNNNPVGW
jgi:peptidyl-dipeptidase A